MTVPSSRTSPPPVAEILTCVAEYPMPIPLVPAIALFEVLFPVIVMASPVVLADEILLVPDAAMRTP